MCFSLDISEKTNSNTKLRTQTRRYNTADPIRDAVAERCERMRSHRRGPHMRTASHLYVMAQIGASLQVFSISIELDERTISCTLRSNNL